MTGGALDGRNEGYGVFTFGSFCLDPVSRTLTQHGARLHLPARLFDTLLFLVENHHRLVEREELSRAVWSTHTVSEGNLGRAISSLRQVLKNAGGDSLIITAPGRGYRFGVPVRVEWVGGAPVEPAPIAGEPPARRGRRWGVIAGAVVAAGGIALLAAWLLPTRRVAADFAPPAHSIAVLPFADRGGHGGDALYSDGIAQELINALGRIGGMEVAASTSSFLFRNSAATIGEIARQLNVGAVLEGSVQRAGARVHVTVELIDARNGFQIWSHVYDQSEADVLGMEGQIAAAVVISVGGVMLGGEAAQLTLGGTNNPAAFDAYLKGIAELNALDADSNRRAIADFNQALALDPGYALAYGRRARALAFIGAFGNSRDVDYSHRVMAAALSDAAHAVALTPELGAAHADFAFVLQTSLADFARAETEYRRAIALAPGDAATLLNYSRFQLEMGHTQAAIAAAKQAAGLDPLAARTYGNLAIILEYARDYDAARQALRRTAMLEPRNTTFQRVSRGMLDTMQGRADAALHDCAGDVDYRDMMCLAIADHMLGRQADAVAELAKARAILGDNGAFLYARVFAEWGQVADAFRWLEIAYRVRDPGLLELKVDPALDGIRDTAQYRELVRRLGFPDP